MTLFRQSPIPDSPPIKLVLMDIDGTLVKGPRSALDNVRHQLNRLRRWGVRFSIATGRTIFGARRVLNDLKASAELDWVIGYNGAVIAHPDASPWIDRLVISEDDLHALLRMAQEYRLGPLVYTCCHRFDLANPERVFAQPHVLRDQKVDFNGMPIARIPDIHEAPTADAVAVLLINEGNAVHDLDVVTSSLQVQFRERLRITTSGGPYIEIAHPDGNKGLAMKKLCAMRGIRLEEVMAIGDNFNDIEMLSQCGFSAAVANSPPEVRQVCHYHCEREAAAGVVEVLRLLAESYRTSARLEMIRKDHSE